MSAESNYQGVLKYTSEERIKRKLEEIAGKCGCEVSVEQDGEDMVFCVMGKRIWGNPNSEIFWAYLAGFRDGIHYAPRWNRQWLDRIVSGSIRSCVNDHGPIHKDLIGSATKRVNHQLKQLFRALFTNNGKWDEGLEEDEALEAGKEGK